jgi:hypothetical protein
MAAMEMLSKRGFLGVSFHLDKCPQGVASVRFKKTPTFGSPGLKLDHLTVHHPHTHGEKETPHKRGA